MSDIPSQDHIFQYCKRNKISVQRFLSYLFHSPLGVDLFTCGVEEGAKNWQFYNQQLAKSDTLRSVTDEKEQEG